MGPENKTLQERLSEQGKWIGKIGECIGVQSTTGLDFVLNWLVSDGIPSRSDMHTLLSPDFNQVGISSSDHKSHGIVVVVVLAKKFYEIDKVTGNFVEGKEAEEATNQSSDLLSRMPEELREIPDDAVGMKVSRYYIEKDGTATTQYVLEYKLKNGLLREEVKEFQGKR